MASGAGWPGVRGRPDACQGGRMVLDRCGRGWIRGWPARSHPARACALRMHVRDGHADRVTLESLDVGLPPWSPWKQWEPCVVTAQMGSRESRVCCVCARGGGERDRLGERERDRETDTERQREERETERGGERELGGGGEGERENKREGGRQRGRESGRSKRSLSPALKS